MGQIDIHPAMELPSSIEAIDAERQRRTALLTKPLILANVPVPLYSSKQRCFNRRISSHRIGTHPAPCYFGRRLPPDATHARMHAGNQLRLAGGQLFRRDRIDPRRTGLKRRAQRPLLAASRLTAVARLLTFVQVAETCHWQDGTRPSAAIRASRKILWFMSRNA